jgi:carboxymethylenebutenolidase
MRKIFILLAVQLVSAGAYAQVCCHAPTTGATASVTKEEFDKAHSTPQPINYQPGKFSTTITFATLDGTKASAFYVPAKNPTREALVIFPELWGVNDHIKKEAEAWQERLGGNIDVYVIDLYDGQIATTPEDAAKLSASVSKDRTEAIVKGLFSEIGATKRVATMGWCMGAERAFKAAINDGQQVQVAATVMYFDVPRVDDGEMKNLKADVIYIGAVNDNFITKETADHFEQQVTGSGHKFERHDFNAPHAFANPDNPNFRGKEAIEAQTYVVSFLTDRLQLKK